MSDLSQEARDLIDSTLHADDPSAADRVRMRSRLAAQLGAAALASTVSASTLGTASGVDVVSASAGSAGTSASSLAAPAGGLLQGGLFKLVVATGLASVIGGSVAWFSRDGELSAAQPARTVDSQPHTASAAAPDVVGATRPRDVVGASTPRVEALEPAPVSVSQPREPSREVSRRQVEVGNKVESSTLKDELALLATAQQALRDGDAKRALAKAEEHRQRFPRGSLREERIGIDALARCALGHDGAEVVATLDKLSPQSPLLARVRQACGLTR
ncbi:MAG: hypothetical protein QM778_32725 [Myxococcales bacterium]